MRFKSTDSTHAQHDGRTITKTEPLSEDFYDRSEVGPMFIATLDNGVDIHVFADEIQEG